MIIPTTKNVTDEISCSLNAYNVLRNLKTKDNQTRKAKHSPHKQIRSIKAVLKSYRPTILDAHTGIYMIETPQRAHQANIGKREHAIGRI